MKINVTVEVPVVLPKGENCHYDNEPGILCVFSQSLDGMTEEVLVKNCTLFDSKIFKDRVSRNTKKCDKCMELCKEQENANKS